MVKVIKEFRYAVDGFKVTHFEVREYEDGEIAPDALAHARREGYVRESKAVAASPENKGRWRR